MWWLCLKEEFQNQFGSRHQNLKRPGLWSVIPKAHDESQGQKENPNTEAFTDWDWNSRELPTFERLEGFKKCNDEIYDQTFSLDADGLELLNEQGCARFNLIALCNTFPLKIRKLIETCPKSRFKPQKRCKLINQMPNQGIDVQGKSLLSC